MRKHWLRIAGCLSESQSPVAIMVMIQRRQFPTHRVHVEVVIMPFGGVRNAKRIETLQSARVPET